LRLISNCVSMFGSHILTSSRNNLIGSVCRCLPTADPRWMEPMPSHFLRCYPPCRRSHLAR
jgi:hypothetical protein